jgi:hypothetical protein
MAKLPERESLYERDDLLRSLRSTVMQITFTKNNGQSRVMRCTLIPTIIEQRSRKGIHDLQADKRFHNENPETLAVWDMDVNDWRAFRVDSVYYAEGLDPTLYIM